MFSNNRKKVMIRYHGGEFLVSREYGVPASLIWKILTDTRLWTVWGPSLKRVECSDRFITVGSRGRLRTVLGIWLPFTIIGFKNMEFWNWRVGGFNATGHQVTSIQPARCRLTFTMPWWASPYLVVCIIALQRIKKITLAKDISNNPLI